MEPKPIIAKGGKRVGYTRTKLAWGRVHQARQDYRRHNGVWVSTRALFKMGLISHQDYLIVTWDDHKLRWFSPGVGRWYKRQLSKARRRAWKTGKEPVKWESECNWKGT